jgi:Spy/CpxP family protein refolding chaperone
MKALLIAFAMAANPDAGPAVDTGAPVVTSGESQDGTGLTLKQQEDAIWKLSITYMDKQKKLAEVRAKDAERQAKAAKVLDEACANDTAARTNEQSLICGDRAKTEGDLPKALTRWREAISSAQNKGQLCGPALRVKRWSLHPEKDLADASPSIVAECENFIAVDATCHTAAEGLFDICLHSGGFHNCHDDVAEGHAKCKAAEDATGWYSALKAIGY